MAWSTRNPHSVGVDGAGSSCVSPTRYLLPIQIPVLKINLLAEVLEIGDRQKNCGRAQTVILFEGWFVGVRPISPAAFDSCAATDSYTSPGEFARDMNAHTQDYLCGSD